MIVHDCSREDEIHTALGFEDKLADIGKYRWSPELVGRTKVEVAHWA